MRWPLWWARRRHEQELDRELQDHLDLEMEEMQESGMTPDEARYGARRAFGNVALTKEDTRAAWGWMWLERLRQDLRYAARMMRRRPGFAAAAVLGLALGIGATTALLGLVYALYVETLPVIRPEELVVFMSEGSASADEFAYPAYDALRRARSLNGVIMMTTLFPGRPAEILDRGERDEAYVQMVSDNYFEMLGVSASMGRTFVPGEMAAVISDDFWRRHYAADPAALGARLQYSNRDLTVVGIAPAGFRGANLDTPTDIWIPFEQTIAPNDASRTRIRWLNIMARLAGRVEAPQAQAEANAILERDVRVERGAVGYSDLRSRLSRPLLLLGLVVGLVMLLTCVNLANLVLVDAAAREQEFGIRRAVGASRARLIRQIFTESLVLAAAGGVLGLLVAHWISGALLGFLPSDQSAALVNLRFEPDLRILSFTVLLSFATSLSFGLAPAFRATRPASRHTTNRVSRSLVVAEVSVCTLLLVVGGVFVRTVQNLRGQDAGYQEDRLLVADVQFPRGYSESLRDLRIEELRLRLSGLPGIEAAAFSHVGQLSGFGIEYPIRMETDPPERVLEIFEQRVSPGFLAAMGTPLLAGRDFSDADDARARSVAIVNEAFLRAFRLDANVVGKRFIKTGGSRGVETIEIVGIAADAKWVSLREDSPPMYYLPYRQQGGTPVVRLAIRTTDDPQAYAAALIQTAASVDWQMILKNVVPFREVVNRTLMVERLIAQVASGFGIFALLIAGFGLYGVLAHSVVRRRREIGVRIAMGAVPRSVAWMVLRECFALLGLGFLIGVPAGVAVTRVMSSMLFGLRPEDPLTIVATLTLLSAATAAAAYLPVRRAVGVDPIAALREE